jgi:hypothetical protein
LQIVPFEVTRGKHGLGDLDCNHDKTTFVVDAKERVVTCKRCGSKVDPYLAIDRFAKRWEMWEARAKFAQAQCDATEKRIETLRRKEREAEKRLAALDRTERIAAEIAGKRPVFGVDAS